MYQLLLDFDEIDEVKSSDVPFHVGLQFEAAFDFNFPFRPLLEFIRARVSEHAGTAELVLPEYIEFEDFIVGELKLPDRTIGVYFEYSLCYLSFSSPRREDLELLVNCSHGLAFHHEGYGLQDG